MDFVLSPTRVQVYGIKFQIIYDWNLTPTNLNVAYKQLTFHLLMTDFTNVTHVSLSVLKKIFYLKTIYIFLTELDLFISVLIFFHSLFPAHFCSVTPAYS